MAPRRVLPVDEMQDKLTSRAWRRDAGALPHGRRLRGRAHGQDPQAAEKFRYRGGSSSRRVDHNRVDEVLATRVPEAMASEAPLAHLLKPRFS